MRLSKQTFDVVDENQNGEVDRDEFLKYVREKYNANDDE